MKKRNPIIDPYLPQFKEVLWFLSGFEEVFTADLKHYHAVKYPEISNNFQNLSNYIIKNYPSRKQVDGLMEMFFFVMCLMVSNNTSRWDEKQTEEIKANYDYPRIEKIQRKCAKFIDKYIATNKVSLRDVFEDRRYSLNSFSTYVRNTFKHYLDSATALEAPYIIDFTWRGLNLDDLITELANREEETRRERRKSGKSLPAGQTWVTFDDGSEWVYIPEYSNKEIASEGDHCATVESWMGENRGRLLYLKDAKGELRLTASYCHLSEAFEDEENIKELEEGEDYGIVGQIRGTANSKPTKKMLPYIAGLLCDERVIYHVPDGYRKKDQFTLKDFDELLKGRVEQCNPFIYNIAEIAAKLKYGIVKEFIYIFNDEITIDDGDLSIHERQPNAVISVWKGDADDFFKYLNQDQTARLFKLLEDGEDIINYETMGEGEAQNLISNLNKKEKALLKKVIKKLHGELEDEKDKTYADAVEENSDLHRAFTRAVNEGYRIGTQSESYKQIVAHAKDLAQKIFEETGFDVEFKENSIYGDNAINIKAEVKFLLKLITPELEYEAIKYLLGADFDSIIARTELREPRNAYENIIDFDADSAREHLVMELNDLS